jgi:hypothetical protein
MYKKRSIVVVLFMIITFSVRIYAVNSPVEDKASLMQNLSELRSNDLQVVIDKTNRTLFEVDYNVTITNLSGKFIQLSSKNVRAKDKRGRYYRLIMIDEHTGVSLPPRGSVKALLGFNIIGRQPPTDIYFVKGSG